MYVKKMFKWVYSHMNLISSLTNPQSFNYANSTQKNGLLGIFYLPNMNHLTLHLAKNLQFGD